MLNHLYRRFVIITMTLLAAVIIGAFGGICVANYHGAMQSVEDALGEELSRGAGGESQITPQFGLIDGVPDFPINSIEVGFVEGSGEESSVEGDEAPGALGTKSQATGGLGSQGADSASRTPKIGGLHQTQERFVPVAVFSLDTASRELSALGNTTALLDETVSSLVADEIDLESDGVRHLAGYGLLYMVRTDAGQTYVAFTDDSTLTDWQTNTLMLVIVATAVLFLLLIITMWLARWALRPVQEAWDKQRRFIADASHDLKTPLTVILADTSILRKRSADTVAEGAQWVESIEYEAKEMQRLVNDLLLLARIDEKDTGREGGMGGTAARLGDAVDFSGLVNRQVLQFESVAFERGIAMETSVADGIKTAGDAGNLGRMVECLVDNACKYTPAGGTVSVTLEAGARRGEGSQAGAKGGADVGARAADSAEAGMGARLTVHNTGVAIPTEELHHVFDRFYRGDRSRTEGDDAKGRSHGLGLAIAKGIVEDHGGSICVASDEGGTTFTVTLP